MLKNSFIILDRIGYGREEKLWRRGIMCWEDFLDMKGIAGISKREKEHHDRELSISADCLEKGLSEHFTSCLKSKDLWRLYPDFKDKACFLDIETTGLSPHSSDLTVLGVYDGTDVRTYIKGVNLTEDSVAEELSRHKLFLSFYGSAFDIPFIQKKYPNIRLNKPHIDLCFASRRLGLTGGLKKIERTLGIERTEDVSGIDGFEAVRLWNRWTKKKDRNALEKLIEYNRADVVNLEVLADIVYDRLREQTFKLS